MVSGVNKKMLGGGSIDDLPDVDPHPFAHQGHLVDQGDVHRPEGVFEQFHHLHRLGRAHGDHLVHYLAVEKRTHPRALGYDPADHFRGVFRMIYRIARKPAFSTST